MGIAADLEEVMDDDAVGEGKGEQAVVGHGDVDGISAALDGEGLASEHASAGGVEDDELYDRFVGGFDDGEIVVGQNAVHAVVGQAGLPGDGPGGQVHG